ncbi:putative lambda family phage portal protein [Magnetofaba australis IT-1]|uniref:Putative lambda family phage portal protein n=2 Tax=Magnetofaba TaxID=1472292 RepID=A0A1Y2KCC4_9PROT|nr:putative lambda family phage portal protein [Magnetofaba australis IT-1]
MRARSRDLVRRNAWASNAVDSLVGNLVGTGIKPQSTHVDPATKEKIQSLWLAWTREADAHGMLGFYGLQALVARAMIEGGEVLVRLRNREARDGLAVPLQLQVLEPEHLPAGDSRDMPNGHRIRAGIEFDRIGRRVAYHLLREHPGESPMLFRAGEASRVLAGDVCHIFKPLRPGQLRGEPWMAQALVRLHELDQYDDAELVRKKTAALIAGFITKPDPELGVGGEDGDKPDDEGAVPVTWAPGTMQVLLPGEDVKFSDPADVGGQYGEFMRTQLRAVAVGLGLTYEQLTGDLTGVNYSSIRAGMVEFRRRMEQIQRMVLIHQFCRPVWERWMDQAVLSGALPLPDYPKRRREYLAVKWIPQGWQWVDPQKEFNAIIWAIRAGLVSRAEAVSTYGYDIEEIDREIAADNRRADDLGLVFDSDARRTSRSGVSRDSTQSDPELVDLKE